MGCIARLGCLFVLAILAIVGWFTRDRWMSHVTGSAPVVASAPVWEPLSAGAGEKGRRSIESLRSGNGPVFANLKASELASYVFLSLARIIPSSADSAEAAVIGDAVFVRAIVPMRDIAGSGALGPLGGLLNDRERISFGGTLRIVRPGLAEFQVREIKLRDFSVPRGAIPKLLEKITHGQRPEGVAADALPVPTPMTLGDVRIANHAITLYKTTGAAP